MENKNKTLFLYLLCFSDCFWSCVDLSTSKRTVFKV